MCLQNMENEKTNITQKSVNKNILELFWNLTNKNSEQRIQTCLSILQSLCKHQDQENDNLSRDLKYCVERLVKGLASPRDAARLGFALLLTKILKQFPAIEIEDVLELIKQHLSFTQKQEKRDIVFGQLFAYSSIIRSGRLANHSHLSFVTLGLCDLWQGRSYILNACYEVLKNLFDQITAEKFATHLWPHLKKKFTDGWNNSSPDNLWLLFLIIRLFPESVGEKYLKKHFNSTNFLAAENFDHLKRFIKQTTSCLPKLHPLSSEISILCGSQKDMKEVWNALVDDNLFDGEQTEKSFVGFEMVKSALNVTKKKKIMKYILSPRFRSLFAKSYINSKSPMNPASAQLADFLSNYAMENKDPEIQMLILKFFLQPPGAILLDQLIRKKEVSLLIQNLVPEAVKIYCEFLKAIALKKKDENEDSGDLGSDHKGFVAVAQIGNLVSHAKVVGDVEWRISVIKFLFLHSFFSIKETTSEILHCEQHVDEISAGMRESCRNAFFKTLTSLYQRVDQQTPMQHSLQCLMLLVEYADQLMAASNNVQPNFSLEKVQDSWLQMKNIVHKLKKQSKKDGKVNETNAFLALFLVLGFYLFHDFEYIADVLEELHICCKKALSSRRHSTDQPDDENEPPWVSVVTDIMLSLLSRSSHHLRRLVTSVFQLLCPFITQEALQQIFAVINPTKASEEPMLVDESDGEDEKNLNFDSGSSSDESDSNEPESSNIDNKFRKKVQEALGSAADISDTESVVLTDSEMFQLDDALAKAFRERVQTGHTQMKVEDRTMLDFRIRCLDLLICYFKSDPPMSLALNCIEPLVAAYEFSHRNEHQIPLLQKIVSTIDSLTKIKKFQDTDNIEKSELKNFLEMLIKKCHKEFNIDVARKLYSLCVFVVLCFKRLEDKKLNKKSTKSPSYLKMYSSALEEFAQGTSSHIYPQFFVTLLEACPDVAWNIIENCQTYAFSKNVRMYRKTQCLGLLFEAIKFAKNQKTISDSQWDNLCRTIIPLTAETLKKTLQETDLKPMYLAELLNIIHTCHMILKEKTNQSILENFKDLIPYLSKLSKNERKSLQKKGQLNWRKVMLSLGGSIESKKKNNDDCNNDENQVEKEEKNELPTNLDVSSPKKRKSTSKENKKKKRKTVSNEDAESND